MVKALLVTIDNTVTEVTYTGYEDLQALVGGYVEAIMLKGAMMYVDEDARMKGYGPDDFNAIARHVCGLGGRVDILTGGILGSVVIAGLPDGQGNDTDVTDEGRRMVELVMREAGGRYVKGKDAR